MRYHPLGAYQSCRLPFVLIPQPLGFVTTELGEDVYCHRTVFTDGTFLTLQGECVVDAKWLWDKNKWQATRLIGASGPPPSVAGVDKPVALGEQGGVVKAWNARG